MSAEQRVRRQVKGVLHVPRWVVVGEIERREVVVVALDLGPLGHGEPEPLEGLDDLVLDADDRVHGARPRSAPGQRQVHALGGERLAVLLGLERLQPGCERLLDPLLGAIGLLADPRAIGGGDRAEPAQERGQLARAPEHAHAQLLEGRRGSGPGDVRQGPVEDFLDPRVPCHPRLALLGGDDRRELREGGRIRHGELG